MITRNEATALTNENIKNYVKQSANVVLAMGQIEQKIKEAMVGSSTVEPKYSTDITKELYTLSLTEHQYVREQLVKNLGYSFIHIQQSDAVIISWV